MAQKKSWHRKKVGAIGYAPGQCCCAQYTKVARDNYARFFVREDKLQARWNYLCGTFNNTHRMSADMSDGSREAGGDRWTEHAWESVYSRQGDRSSGCDTLFF